ncbi:MAG: isochorismatase family protein [Elusimicrobia bacterium]|nr:isochorismatase family protein [Elusimicrobiota bacterium]
MPAILITQCLQNDFVKPIARFEPLPNLLHVGHEESARLMGENPPEGPVVRMMQWAYGQVPRLKIIHIRDWHDAQDPEQQAHMRQFGEHCLALTWGADFAFQEPKPRPGSVEIMDSMSLNDFIGTRISSVLEPYRGKPARVGLIGVWTEAKITFLAYDLRARYPDFDIAVCSALTASSSRAQHFMALDQLRNILGVRIAASIGEFVEFLGGDSGSLPLGTFEETRLKICMEGAASLSGADTRLLRYLFRDAKELRCRPLDGGFSGNVVLGAESTDIHGHAQAPHVVKIGPHAPIGRERASFERIESVLGNSAPRIADYADFADRGAIKYRYAAMGPGKSTTFQKIYCAGVPLSKIRAYLEAVFHEQLGRLYQAGKTEKCNLLEYYGFRPDMAARIKTCAKELVGEDAAAKELKLPGGVRCPNPYHFYVRDLERLLPIAQGAARFAYVHGDLNGANIIIDSRENVWLIDFFHTHRGHILKDLIKLENDLLYIFTPVRSAAELGEAARLSDHLMAVEDIGKPPAKQPAARFKNRQFQRAYEAIRMLRSFYPELIHSDRDSLQLLIGQMRYSAHTLSFEESNLWQKRWALYATGRCGAAIAEHFARRLKQ